MITEQFAPVAVKHPVLGEQMADSQAKLDVLLKSGFELVQSEQAKPAGTSTATQRKQEWTTDVKRAKKVTARQNENRRTVPPGVKEGDTFEGKVYRFKLTNEGQPDEYCDTQLEYNGTRTCVAFQDFHEIGATITLTAVARADGEGLKWNTSL